MIVSRKTASSCQEQGGFSIGHFVSAITHILAKKTIVKKSYFVIWVIPLSGSSFNRLSFTMAPLVSYHKMMPVHSRAAMNFSISLHAKSLALTGRGFFDE